MNIKEILDQLKPDPWRTEVGFSPDIQMANQILFDPQSNDTTCSDVINQWLETKKNQPCLFGKLGARLGLISYCSLKEKDLYRPEDEVKKIIQDARTKWSAEGYYGEKSAFVIAVVSEKIANAIPDNAVKELAKRICFLYLETEVEEDKEYHDSICLEFPTRHRETFEWPTGINYFCSQGDKRWWQDHRIPGGMAFSINSVGHMVKAGKLNNKMPELQKIIGEEDEEWTPRQIDSLQEALEFAMRTIHLAADGVSGKATNLLLLPEDKMTLPVQNCPIDLPKFLKDKNFCEYQGFYHTDVTIPSEYFVPDIEKPPNQGSHSLDFTYLFHKDIENPYFETMGEGRRIRNGDTDQSIAPDRWMKIERGQAKIVQIKENELLNKALKLYPSKDTLGA